MVLPAPHGAMAQVTFVVNSNADNSNLNPGDGNCNTGEEVGTVTIGGIPVPIMECTLHAAIEEANESSENVIINFNSGWLDVHTDGYTQIFLQSALPYISNRVTIAGETVPVLRSFRPTSPICNPFSVPRTMAFAHSAAISATSLALLSARKQTRHKLELRFVLASLKTAM